MAKPHGQCPFQNQVDWDNMKSNTHKLRKELEHAAIQDIFFVLFAKLLTAINDYGFIISV